MATWADPQLGLDHPRFQQLLYSLIADNLGEAQERTQRTAGRLRAGAGMGKREMLDFAFRRTRCDFGTHFPCDSASRDRDTAPL